MKWNNKGHEFDAVSKRICNTSIKCYIWGAGTFGISFHEKFLKELEFIAYVDSNKKKQGGIVCGLNVISPEEFQNRFDENNEIVIVSTGLTNSVYSKLNQLGLVRNINYFHIDDYSSVYMLEKYNKVYVSDITVEITQRCTLRCEYCNAFIPKIQHPQSYSLANIMDELSAYFRWVNGVNVLGLCGGDAMSHPQFNNVLASIGEKYYPERVDHIEIYSNAVIIPNDVTIELFKKYNVFYRFTDYGGNSGKQNIDGVIQVLQDNDIRYDHVKFDNWYDCGYPQRTNGISSEKGLIDFCTRCDRKSCHGIWDKKLFTCSVCHSAAVIDYCELDKSDYFDLSTYDEGRRKEFLEYYLGYSEKGYYNYCKMCNGGMNVNTHAISAGNQL